MSTTELYLDDEEIANFIRETKIAPQYFYGYEGEEYGVCPYITFYILHKKEGLTEDKNGGLVKDEAFERLSGHMIDAFESLQKLMDRPFKKTLKCSTEVWFKVGDKRMPDLRDEVKKAITKNTSFWLQATDKDNPASSARWAIDARVARNPYMRFTTLKITFRHEWYQSHQAQWHAFVHQLIGILQPEQCYSGFEIGNTASGFGGSYEAGVMERICANHFYGVDIDHPGKMGFHRRFEPDEWQDPSSIGTGLRTPTWCFLLSPYWMGRLALTEETLYQAFAGQDVRIQRIRHMDASVSYWVQLGELDLHPVENGIPPALAAANRLIKPVRCNDLELTSLDPWDDDPNPRFDDISGPLWMARFDEDSQWPSPALRQPVAPPQAPAQQTQGLSAQPGQPCPKEGLWFAPHLQMKEVRMKQGEPMPGQAIGITGGVTWYFKG
jgi:hypothetical protein